MKLKSVYATWQDAVRDFSVAYNNRNIAGSVTLTNSATTTTVNTAGARADSYIFLMPTDANSAAETPHISAKAQGSFTITHANAVTTRTFDYLIINK